MQEFLKTLAGWNGAVQGDATHKRIVDTYNSFLPHPRGHKLTYSDAWCAAMVSAAAIACGLTDVIPIECSCGEQISAYQARGQWIEADDHVPQVGEQVFYSWSDGKEHTDTDCTAAPNHTGVVTAVAGDHFTVIEGNKGTEKVCGYREMKINGRYIRGFGCPSYPTEEQNEKLVLARGDKREEVKSLQTMLNAVGYALDIDGSFGPATQRAWGEYLAAWIRKVTEE